MEINQMSSVAAASLLQQQVDDAQKRQGHGGSHSETGEKFAAIAQAAAGMKPSTAQTREAPKGKDASRKDKRSDDQEDEVADDRQPPPRNSRNADVSV